MASIIPGYEYDIFISYRQKDNKHDGWVTEFVNNLMGELESTFKEEIGVYFDINPHDGILNTHDVDASLQSKLKCLIFIPIISRTYCDPNSFAWQYEFKTFVKQSSEDHYGLKVKLLNGNVASRILPVLIHDLNPDDKKAFELEAGVTLRAIEFVYKESGVNRPLRSNEDRPGENLNKIYYRNQINRVANSIEELIHALVSLENSLGEKSPDLYSQYLKPQLKDKELKTRSLIILNRSKSLRKLLLIILFAISVFSLIRIIKNTNKNLDINRIEKSIAVLPFINDSPSDSTTYFINGVMEEILNNLQKIKDFRVLSRTSTEKYRTINNLTIPQIAKDLGVNYLVEGSGQKYGNKFVLHVQLIAARNERHLWGESYEQEISNTNDIFQLQGMIAQEIAGALQTNIVPELQQLIRKVPTEYLSAYDYYQQGEYELSNYKTNNANRPALQKAQNLFNKALGIDTTYAKAYIGLANVFIEKNIYRSYFSNNFLDSSLILANRALSFDNKLADAYVVKAWYYLANKYVEKARKECNNALLLNPNSWEAYECLGWYIYANSNNPDYVKSIECLEKAISLNRGKELPGLIRKLGAFYYWYAGFPDKLRQYNDEALKLNNDTVSYLLTLGTLEISQGNLDKGLNLLFESYKKDSTNISIAWEIGQAYMYHGEYKKALKYFRNYIQKNEELEQFVQGSMHRIGYVFLQNDLKNEAEYWFDKQIKLSEESIKLGRNYSSYFGAYYDLAGLWALKGNNKKTYEYLHNVNNQSVYPRWFVQLIKDEDPFFKNIRNESAFQAIVQNIETKYQTEHERVRKWLEEQGKI